jgi:hypothetical protein
MKALSLGSSATLVWSPSTTFMDLSNLTASSTSLITMSTGSNLGVTNTLRLESGSVVQATGVCRFTAPNMLLLQGSFIDGNSRGYGPNSGPGAATSSPGGAAHAGCGSLSACNIGGTTGVRSYNSIYAPTDMGSGGFSNGASGGTGGAAFRFIVNGSLVLNGTVSVDGGAGAGNTGCCAYSGGGAAGGAVWITANTLLPSYGTVTARGGAGSDGYSNLDAGAGSGGRISVQCQSHSYASRDWKDWGLQTLANGGVQIDGVTAAAPGTVWLDCGSRNATLLLDNGAAARTLTPAHIIDPIVSYTFEEVRLLRGANLQLTAQVGSNTTTFALYNLTGDSTGRLFVSTKTSVLLSAKSTVYSGGDYELDLPVIGSSSSGDNMWTVAQQRTYFLDQSSYALTAASITVNSGGELVTPSIVAFSSTKLTVNGVIRNMKALSLGSSATLVWSPSTTFTDLSNLTASSTSLITMSTGSNLGVTNTLRLESGSVVQANGVCQFTAPNMLLLQGSFIDGNSRGYGPNSGPGAATSSPGGAAHAGCGSLSACNIGGTTGVRSYNSIYAPTDMGSGGFSNGASGGTGGAAFRFIVNGSLVLNGTVSVDGGAGAGNTGCCAYSGGGAAGGAVWITANTLLPSYGTVTARGGAGSDGYSNLDAGAGSGGRISVQCQSHSYASRDWKDWGLQTLANGGVQIDGVTAAAPGTVWLDCGSRSATLLLDNGAAARTLTPANIVDTGVSFAFAELRLLRGANLWLSANAGSNTSVYSVTALTGDTTGRVTAATTTSLMLASQYVYARPGDYELDVSAATLTQPSVGMWQVQQVRSFFIDQAAFALAAASVTINFGALLVTPPAVTVANTALIIKGSISGARNVSVGSSGVLQLATNGRSVGFPSSVFDFLALAVSNSGTLQVDSFTNISAVNITLGQSSTARFYDGCVIAAVNTLRVGAAASVYVNDHVLMRADYIEVASTALIEGSGRGPATAAGSPSVSGSAVGGAHAGCGTVACSMAQIAGTYHAYGDVVNPVDTGSAGQAGSQAGGGAGGAAVRLQALSRMVMNGTIQVNGVAGASNAGCCGSAGGGGSGGSVLLTTDVLLPSFGTILSHGANGGDGYSTSDGTAGSGGRISVQCREDMGVSTLSSMTLRSYGGGWPAYASSGTIYVNCGRTSRYLSIASPAGTTVVRDTNILATNTTSYKFDTVSLTGYSQFVVGPSGAALPGMVTTFIRSLAGDATGKVVINPSTTVVMGITNATATIDNAVSTVQYMSAMRRQYITVSTYFTNASLITAVNLVVNANGILVLPNDVFVCGVDITNNANGVIQGAANNITFCPAHANKRILGSGTIKGCTWSNSSNYNPLATVNDGSCMNVAAPRSGCTYQFASNFDSTAVINDGSCLVASGLVTGCTNPAALTYNPAATFDDGSCAYNTSLVRGCIYKAANNFNWDAQVDDGSCAFPELSLYSAQVAIVQDQLSSAQAQITALQQQLDAATAASQAKDVTIASLTTQLADKQTALTNANSACDARVAVQNSTLAVSNVALATCSANLAASSSTAAACAANLTTTRNDLQASMSSAAAAAATCTTNINTVTQSRDTCTSQLATSQASNTATNNAWTADKATLASTNQTLLAAQTQLAICSQSLATSSASLSSCQSSLATAGSSLSTCQSSLATCGSGTQSSPAPCNCNNAASPAPSCAANSQLPCDTSALQATISTQAQQISTYSTSLQQCSTDKTTLTSTVFQLRSDVDGLKLNLTRSQATACNISMPNITALVKANTDCSAAVTASSQALASVSVQREALQLDVIAKASAYASALAQITIMTDSLQNCMATSSACASGSSTCQAQLLSSTLLYTNASAASAACSALTSDLRVQLQFSQSMAVQYMNLASVYSAGFLQCSTENPSFSWNVTAALWNQTVQNPVFTGTPFPASWPVHETPEYMLLNASLAACSASRTQLSVSATAQASAYASVVLQLEQANNQLQTCTSTNDALTANLSSSTSIIEMYSQQLVTLNSANAQQAAQLQSVQVWQNTTVANLSTSLSICQANLRQSNLIPALSALSSDLTNSYNDMSRELGVCQSNLADCFNSNTCQANSNCQASLDSTTSQLNAVSNVSAQCFSELSTCSGRTFTGATPLTWPWPNTSPQPKVVCASAPSPLPSLAPPSNANASPLPMIVAGSLMDQPFYFISASGSVKYSVSLFFVQPSLLVDLNVASTAISTLFRSSLANAIGINVSYVSISEVTELSDSQAATVGVLSSPEDITTHAKVSFVINIPTEWSMQETQAMLTRLKTYSPASLFETFINHPLSTSYGVTASTPLGGSLEREDTTTSSQATTVTTAGVIGLDPVNAVILFTVVFVVITGCLIIGGLVCLRKRSKSQQKSVGVGTHDRALVLGGGNALAPKAGPSGRAGIMKNTGTDTEVNADEASVTFMNPSFIGANSSPGVRAMKSSQGAQKGAALQMTAGVKSRADPTAPMPHYGNNARPSDNISPQALKAARFAEVKRITSVSRPKSTDVTPLVTHRIEYAPSLARFDDPTGTDSVRTPIPARSMLKQQARL